MMDVSVEQVRALCKLLESDGQMTPVATRQILRCWDEGDE
jgi:hypothetical protein